MLHWNLSHRRLIGVFKRQWKLVLRETVARVSLYCVCFDFAVGRKKKKAERETARGHRLEGSGGIRASAKADSCGFRLGGGLNHCTISRLRNILLLITPSILLPMLVFGPGAWSHVSLSGLRIVIIICSAALDLWILYTLHLRRTVCQSLYKQHGIVCWQAASQLLTLQCVF